MNKLNNIFELLFNWCKCYPYFSSSIALCLLGLSLIVNWPPIPFIQPLAWEVSRYANNHDSVGTELDENTRLRLRMEDTTDIAINQIVKKYIKLGMFYEDLKKTMESNNYRCYYHPYQKGKHIDSHILYCSMLDPTLWYKSPTFGIGTNYIATSFILDINTYNVVAIATTANYH
jgi:hypothetical protein